jgi:XTP/dITP diphosphohydrolase
MAADRMRVVIASSNPGKLRELSALLAPLGLNAAPQSEFTAAGAEETGLTFVENAILTARHACRASALAAIADDSGIEVDALHGAPGVYSARYAGAGASDEANLRKLLRELQAASPAERTARYQCVLVYMRFDADPSPIIAQASWDGRILESPRGAGGFGYDPIFQPAEGGALSAAELSAEEKNRLSHRGKALRLLLDQLRAARSKGG